MTHLLRNIIALGCFAGFATVNGCSAQTGPVGQEEAAGAPVGEAQEAWSSGNPPPFNPCNISASPAPLSDPCAQIICNTVGDLFCCSKSGNFDGQCVNEALSFCRNLPKPAQNFCTACPGTPTIFNPFPSPNICSVLNTPFDFGCPGFSWDENLPPPGCVARVCEQNPMCCEDAWNDKNGCRVLANRICAAGCNVTLLPPSGNNGNGKGNGG